MEKGSGHNSMSNILLHRESTQTNKFYCEIHEQQKPNPQTSTVSSECFLVMNKIESVHLRTSLNSFSCWSGTSVRIASNHSGMKHSHSG